MATVIYNDQIQDQGSSVYQDQVLVQDQYQDQGAPVILSEPESEAVDNQVGNQDLVEEEENVDADGRVFGYRNGFLHAALGVSGEWTDNLYNTDTEKEENF